MLCQALLPPSLERILWFLPSLHTSSCRRIPHWLRTQGPQASLLSSRWGDLMGPGLRTQVPSLSALDFQASRPNSASNERSISPCLGFLMCKVNPVPSPKGHQEDSVNYWEYLQVISIAHETDTRVPAKASRPDTVTFTPSGQEHVMSLHFTRNILSSFKKLVTQLKIPWKDNSSHQGRPQSVQEHALFCD